MVFDSGTKCWHCVMINFLNTIGYYLFKFFWEENLSSNLFFFFFVKGFLVNI